VNSLDSVKFDTTGLLLEGDREGARFWHTTSGDRIFLYYYLIPPDIRADLDAINQVRALYRRGLAQFGEGLLELDVLRIDDCKLVRLIVKAPQPPGMGYIGSLTLPFRDFSYVIKVQCLEMGVTGLREAVVLAGLLSSGKVTTGKNGELEGLIEDLYDPSVTSRVARNKSEAEEYDSRFPDHPLSRLRLLLRQIQSSLTVDKEVKEAPAFETGTEPIARIKTRLAKGEIQEAQFEKLAKERYRYLRTKAFSDLSESEYEERVHGFEGLQFL
jgi:hypothetical protein